MHDDVSASHHIITACNCFSGCCIRIFGIFPVISWRSCWCHRHCWMWLSTKTWPEDTAGRHCEEVHCYRSRATSSWAVSHWGFPIPVGNNIAKKYTLTMHIVFPCAGCSQQTRVRLCLKWCCYCVSSSHRSLRPVARVTCRIVADICGIGTCTSMSC